MNPPPATGDPQHQPNPDAGHSDRNPNAPDPHSPEYAPYPKLDPNDVVPPPDPLLSQPTAPPHPGGADSSTSADVGTTTMPPESNPYVSASGPAPKSGKNPMDTMKDVLGKWGKKAAEAAKKTEVLAGDMWQHLKTSPSVADAAVGRIAQQTKVLTEGGYEKVYRQTFETLSDEKLKKCYACYLSTSAGPVMGILYLSTTKLAFCSDNPLSYQVGERTEWSYYKVVIPLHQLKAVNPSTSKVKPSEKYIQIISIDNHEFWFMGFVNYESAVKSLQGVIDERSL